MPKPGTTALYRPVPRDFDEMFIRLGWTSIEAHYRAHWRSIAKWVLLRDLERVKEGHEPLRVMRAAYVAKHGPAKSVVRVDYVGTRRPSRPAPLLPRPYVWPLTESAPKFWEAGLLPEPAPLTVRRARHRSRMMAVTKAAALVEQEAKKVSDEYAAGMAKAVEILRAQAEVV